MSVKKNTVPYILLGTGIAATLALTGYLVLRHTGKKVPCNGRFLFIGDSNTVNSVSYSKQLKQYCNQAVVKELAANGRNTSDMLSSLRAELANNHYDAVMILGGSNDLGTNIDTKANLQLMYDLAKSKGARVVAITPPSKNYIRSAQPTWGGNNYSQLLEKLKNIVNWQLSNRTPDLVVNWNKITDKKELFASDMQHPNQVAHALLLNEIIKKLPISNKA